MKEKILALRSQGLSYRKIAKALNLTVFRVEYYANPDRLRQLRVAAQRYRKKKPIAKKVANFHGRFPGSESFTTAEFLAKIGDTPVCFFTKTPIDLLKPDTYSIDHLIPVAQGGTNDISNAELVRSDVNMLKMNRTPEQFLTACREVLEAQGYRIEPPSLLH